MEQQMRVFVTGGTGFVGNEVIRQLIKADHHVVALVRQGSSEKLPEADGIKTHSGDVMVPETLTEGMRDCDAVIHLVGIIRAFPDKGVTFDRLHVQATQNVLRAAVDNGISKYLHMSANGARADSEIDYQKTKWQAEQWVRESGLDWTIFRPTVIFGAGGEFIEQLGDIVRKTPIVPVVGDGQYRLQPVAVEEVARTYVNALEMTDAFHETYHLGGTESYSYDTIFDLIGEALGKDKVRKAHQPVGLAKPIVNQLENFEKFPITSDQLSMLLEGNECDQEPWANAFKVKPTSFAEGVRKIFQ